jgi:DNA-binding transcriptional LysR family regulator
VKIEMTIVQLRYLTVLYESANATQAAQKLHVTRPALTNGIRQLEEELQVQLVVSQNNKLSFTEIGKVVVMQAQKILANVDELYRIVHNHDDHVFKIGLLSNIQPIMEQISNYHEEKISLSFQEPAELYQSIKRRQLDLAFTVLADQQPIDDPELQFDPVFEDHLGVFAIPENRLNRNGQAISYEELQTESVIVSRDQANEKFIDQIMAKHGSLNIIFSTPGINLVGHIMDNETVLIGRKMQLLFSPHKDEIELVELPNQILNRVTFSFGWLYLADHQFSKSERSLIRNITAAFYEV